MALLNLAILKDANLQFANLFNAQLEMVDFSGANLEHCNLGETDLNVAKLNGAIMPDGTVYKK